MLILNIDGAVVPPPWANPGNNPCASQPGGWQLLYWPLDGKCYKIFHKGYPCPDSMELTPGANMTAECRCPPGSAQNPQDSLCHRLYSLGPCKQGEYFAPMNDYTSNYGLVFNEVKKVFNNKSKIKLMIDCFIVPKCGLQLISNFILICYYFFKTFCLC